jgi:hypothetical protein
MAMSELIQRKGRPLARMEELVEVSRSWGLGFRILWCDAIGVEVLLAGFKI